MEKGFGLFYLDAPNRNIGYSACMKIHEYQAKELLRLYEVPTPIGSLVASTSEARRVAEDLGGRVVVKAQVHAGGRGLGGGVKLASSPDEAAQLYERIHGMTLVTKQTGPAGKIVRRVYIEAATDFLREFYLALAIDRKSGRVVLLASSQGGSAVEDAARDDNAAFGRLEIDGAIGPAAFALRGIADKLEIGGKAASDFIDIARKSYRLFIENDCELLEINPLAQTSEGRLVALDCKMSFDDSALFRHPKLLGYRDVEEEVPEELEAAKHGLSYVKLDGNIGCLVNGAGLALATLDALATRGGLPANFLDIGGSASGEAIERAFSLIIEDGRCKAALVNVFGGIMSCETVASGIVHAVSKSGTKLPIVARLSGNSAELGRRILAERVANVRFADDLEQAASMATAAAVGSAAHIER